MTFQIKNYESKNKFTKRETFNTIETILQSANSDGKGGTNTHKVPLADLDNSKACFGFFFVARVLASWHTVFSLEGLYSY